MTVNSPSMDAASATNNQKQTKTKNTERITDKKEYGMVRDNEQNYKPAQETGTDKILLQQSLLTFFKNLQKNSTRNEPELNQTNNKRRKNKRRRQQESRKMRRLD